MDQEHAPDVTITEIIENNTYSEASKLKQSWRHLTKNKGVISCSRATKWRHSQSYVNLVHRRMADSNRRRRKGKAPRRFCRCTVGTGKREVTFVRAPYIIFTLNYQIQTEIRNFLVCQGLLTFPVITCKNILRWMTTTTDDGFFSHMFFQKIRRTTKQKKNCSAGDAKCAPIPNHAHHMGG